MMSNSLPDPARLAAAAGDAARIRALALDPDVIALRVERIRAQVDTCSWVAIGLGLAFTAVNVQTFAAAGAPAGSPAWLVAWLLDPMVSLLLIAVLRAEQVTARWQVPTGWRVTAAKWGCFAATYAMNTWTSWTAGAPSGVVLHSVPPLVVLLGAEVAPELRDRLTAAVTAAVTGAARPTSPTAATQLTGHPGSDLPGEAVPPADHPGQDRVAAAAVLLTAGPRPGHDPAPAPEPALTDVETDLEVTADPAVAAPAPEPSPDAASDGVDDVQDRHHDVAGAADARVAVLVELLAAGAPVTGAQAAALHEVSDRQGRRLLREAREQSRTTVPAPATTPATTPAPRGVLRVVPNGPGTDAPATTTATTTATTATTAATTATTAATNATTATRDRGGQ